MQGALAMVLEMSLTVMEAAAERPEVQVAKAVGRLCQF